VPEPAARPAPHPAGAETERALCDPVLDRVVDLVLRPLGDERYRVADHTGSHEFQRRAVGGRWSFESTAVTGTDPLARQDPAHWLGLPEELASLSADRRATAYPWSFERVAQLFDAAHAPDAVVIHTPDHHFHGNLGEHGSLGVVQSRAPFLAAGAGIRGLGLLDAHIRMVDVAPTMAAVLGCGPAPGAIGATGESRPDAVLSRQDGDVLDGLLDGSRADHVVAFLVDGTNANVLYDVIAAGEAPTLADLLARGTAYRGGCLASLPTATLANHTTALTGAHPGHSGVLHNVWHDRHLGADRDLLELSQMIRAAEHLAPGVETIHEAVHRAFPSAFTATTYEYADRGADWSTYELLRRGERPPFPGKGDLLPHASGEWVERSSRYRFMSRVDTASTAQAIALWSGEDHPPPTFLWVNLSLTDESGHEAGPHAEQTRAAIRDSDRRIGAVLDAVERVGGLDRTAVFVLADHGMELTDPDNTAPYAPALTDAGIAHRDIGDGFLYLGT
jgi:phosphonoacetate hydrolase